MSHLRRFKPDEQDASLKRLQEISITHHRLCSMDLTSQSSLHEMIRKDSDGEDTPAFDDEDISQLSKADKWNTLYSILLAMKDKPFDEVEENMKPSPDLLENQHHLGKLNTEDELQLELLAVQRVLKKKTLQLQRAEEERDSALVYIRNLKTSQEEKLPSSEIKIENLKLYKCGMESLRDSAVSKESVLALLSPLVEEFHRQKVYLDHLMTVTLMRAPWILDEVDKLEISNCEQSVLRIDDDEEGR